MYSCSRDGRIKLWNLENGTCSSTWDIPEQLPIESMTVVGDMAYMSCFWRGEEAGRALAFDFVEGEAKEVRVKLSTPRQVVSCLSSAQNPVIATHDRHTILVWDAKSFGSKSPLALHHTKAFTCVAVSPDGTKVAAGDVSGRILIWHDVQEALTLRSMQGEEEENDERPWAYVEPPAATVHWHAHPVGCVSFSRDGKYILSGGQEAVLVLWDVQSGLRAYLPRLGGPLVGISSCRMDPAKYCLRQLDNTIRTVNTASMVIESSIHGVRPLPDVPGHPAAIFESHSGNAVVVGPHAVLQFYDVYKDVHVDRLQLSRRNIVSMSESHGKELSLTSVDADIQCLAFSLDASLLVTVESKPDASGASSTANVMKFWNRVPDESRQYGAPYTLNTISENPHKSSSGTHAITGVAINPSLDIVGTSSTSGDFALWATHVTESSGEGHIRAWKKIAMITGHRGDPLTSITFSMDGTVAAVSGAQQASGGVSLWDTATCSFIGELPPAFACQDAPEKANALQRDSLFFLPDLPTLVFVCQYGIAVYNVLSMSIVWSADISNICMVTPDPYSQHWAIVMGSDVCKGPMAKEQYASGAVVLFCGEEDHPKAAWMIRRQHSSLEKPAILNPATTPRNDRSIRSNVSSCRTEIAFVPPKTRPYEHAQPLSIPGCSPLLVFSQDREFSLAISPEITDIDDVVQSLADDGIAASPPTQAGAAGQSGYEQIFGVQARHHTTRGSSPEVQPSLPAHIKLFDAPSHALPPMTALCTEFLSHLLTK